MFSNKNAINRYKLFPCTKYENENIFFFTFRKSIELVLKKHSKVETLLLNIAIEKNFLRFISTKTKVEYGGF